MKILLLDNFDSFTYNIFHLLKDLGINDVSVRRNNQIVLSDVAAFDRIVLSPGPGIPMEAGVMPELVKTFAPSRPIFGVCLGHQCIGEAFGAKLKNLETPLHGQARRIEVVADDLIFRGLAKSFTVGRYHSWVVDNDALPSELEVTARDEEGEIMALRHKTFDVRGVQFHPESVLTEYGHEMMENWLKGGV